MTMSRYIQLCTHALREIDMVTLMSLSTIALTPNEVPCSIGRDGKGGSSNVRAQIDAWRKAGVTQEHHLYTLGTPYRHAWLTSNWHNFLPMYNKLVDAFNIIKQREPDFVQVARVESDCPVELLPLVGAHMFDPNTHELRFAEPSLSDQISPQTLRQNTPFHSNAASMIISAASACTVCSTANTYMYLDITTGAVPVCSYECYQQTRPHPVSRTYNDICRVCHTESPTHIYCDVSDELFCSLQCRHKRLLEIHTKSRLLICKHGHPFGCRCKECKACSHSIGCRCKLCVQSYRSNLETFINTKRRKVKHYEYVFDTVAGRGLSIAKSPLTIP
jgi:hypothetical protein